MQKSSSERRIAVIMFTDIVTLDDGAGRTASFAHLGEEP